MKKFNFRLDPLLRVREQLEEARKRKLAESMSREDAAHADIARVAGEQSAAAQQMRDAKTGRVNAAQLKLLNRYLAGLQQTRHKQEASLHKLRGEVAQRRDELIEAAQERKAVETVREHRLEEHRAETGREEQNLLDEAAQVRAKRKAS
ncbi:MAG: flagellar export protein FliJ [Planctomycetes bacterium]|nr:flagellar export protein FliJ [Planctomycetota bacterium]